jgi:hypothetical protein
LPARPTCPACGATIQHAETADGTRIPLEIFTEPTGAGRYRVVRTEPVVQEERTRIIVEPVGENAMVDAYPDHRKECPDYGNGLG